MSLEPEGIIVSLERQPKGVFKYVVRTSTGSVITTTYPFNTSYNSRTP